MADAPHSYSHRDEPWRVLEFYSGIGGMRYSLMRAGVNAKVVQAFDINDKANDVYEHNFSDRPYQIGVGWNDDISIQPLSSDNYMHIDDEIHEGNIQSLTASDLDNFGAHAWLLSPPCQPYTRQGLQKDSGDARAFSFLQILELIQLITQPPSMIFVENVVGFEVSDTHAKMIEMFVKTNYVLQEFILSPLQFGVPYSRPRYFCLAKRKPFSFHDEHFNNQLIQYPGPLSKVGYDMICNKRDQPEESWDMLLFSCESIHSFLESYDTNDVLDTGSVSGHGCDASSLDLYLVPLSLVERWGSAMDIVSPDSKRCCCFTKSYYRYVKGTGSLLATVQPEKKDEVSSLKEQRLRYFTPREVANLHSFPKDFNFPNHISLRQRYALLGNSLSIAVVAPLLRYLFAGP